MGIIYDRLAEAYQSLGLKEKVELAVVLGSAQGGCISFDSTPAEIPFWEIKNFPPRPQRSAVGHAKRFLFGKIEGVETAVMDGRLHYYEGYNGEQIAFPIRLLKLMGAKTVVITNAAGGLNPDFRVGDLMLMTDHLTLFLPPDANPLMQHEEKFSSTPHLPQVPGALYDKELLELAKGIAEKNGIVWREGNYVFAPGPQYESGLDVRLLRGLLKADSVGMSTVPEAMAAHQLGVKVLGIAGITNVMKGESNPTTPGEVIEQAAIIGPKINRLVHGLALGLE